MALVAGYLIEMLETFRVNLFRQSLPIDSGKNTDECR